MPSPSHALSSVAPTPTPSLPATAGIPTQAEIISAVARWLPTYSYFELPATLYVLTGTSDFQIGFDARRPTLLEAESRQAISAALGADHKVIFVDDPTPLIPSPHPDVAVSWDWGDGGALVGFSMDVNALTSAQPNVVASVNNGDRGTDVLVTVGWEDSSWEVVTVGRPAQWVT